MPNKNKSKPQASKRGPSAISSIIKTSRDQLREVAVGRYVKRGGMSQIISDIRELRRMVNTEEKHFDTITGATSVVSGTSQVLAIGSMAEGADSNQRTGRSIKIVRTDLLMSFQYSTGTAATMAQQNQIFNWYYVKYLKTPTSSGQTAFNIDTFLDVDPGGNYTPISLPDPDNNQNFAILESGTVTVQLQGPTTATSTVTAIVPVTNNRSFHQTYNSTTAASICDNMTFMVFIAFNPLNAGGLSNVAFSVRQWYVDN